MKEAIIERARDLSKLLTSIAKAVASAPELPPMQAARLLITLDYVHGSLSKAGGRSWMRAITS